MNNINQKNEYISLVTFDQVKEALLRKVDEVDVPEFEHKYTNNNILYIRKTNGNFYNIGELEHIAISFGTYESDSPYTDGDSWIVSGTDYFSPRDIDKAINTFLERLNSAEPWKPSEKGNTLPDIKVINTGKLEFGDPRLYIDAILDRFIKIAVERRLIHPSEVSMIMNPQLSINYDNVLDHGNPINRMCMMYLLASIFDTNYSKFIKYYTVYISVFEQAEKEVLKERYGIDS